MAVYFYAKDNGRKKDETKINRRELELKKYAKKSNLEYDNANIYNDWEELDPILQEGDMVILKDVRGLGADAKEGYKKYRQLMDRNIELVLKNNLTLNTDYIRQMHNIAEKQKLLAVSRLPKMEQLLFYTEFDRINQKHKARSDKIKAGIETKERRSGREVGTMDKLTPELEKDIIIYLDDKTQLPVEIMSRHNISKNTFYRYARYIRLKMGQEK